TLIPTGSGSQSDDGKDLRLEGAPLPLPTDFSTVVKSLPHGRIGDLTSAAYRWVGPVTRLRAARMWLFGYAEPKLRARGPQDRSCWMATERRLSAYQELPLDRHKNQDASARSALGRRWRI